MNRKQPLVSLWTAALCLLVLGKFSSAVAAGDLPTMTRQVVLARSGSGYQWQLETAPLPRLGADQVLIEVHAAALNHGELELLGPDGGHDRSGFVVGSDVAGEIIAVGSSVHDFRKGERVVTLYFNNWTQGPFNHVILADQHGWNTPGVFADYLVRDATSIAQVPTGLTYEEAATLPTAGLTAWTAVTLARRVQPGDVALLQGTGGVSMFALQFARAMGARAIITSSSDGKLARAHALGASDLINYRTTPQWADQVRSLTHQHGADLIVDVGGKDTLEQSLASLADDGTLSLVGGLTGFDGKLPEGPLVFKRARAQGIYVGSRADYMRMAAFIAGHHLHPVIDRVFPLSQYQQALAYMQGGGFVGKVVIRWR
ncbi:MAG TPA: NAD(P)-dependent alcohol dehydrogenase [Steroidobacteraceae bacterium]|nr:NAD(P)-dependent alcohol dehydrogenase [Steroidobacteraceae bacterium]